MARPRHEALNNRKRLRLKRAGHPHRRRPEVRIPSAPPGRGLRRTRYHRVELGGEAILDTGE
jgi:hypothetical protein